MARFAVVKSNPQGQCNFMKWHETEEMARQEA